VNSWLSILTASLLGSLHCVGMCGGLVSFYSAGDCAIGAARWGPHAAYHLTRLVAYVLLGALAGRFGAVLDGVGSSVGLGDLGVLVASLTLLSWGLPRLLGRRRARGLIVLGQSPARRPRLIARLERLFVAFVSRVRQSPPVSRASALGLSSALLPCGWLYAFVVLAAGRGSALAGGGLLAAFWLGTVPALLGLGVGIGRLSEPLRARLPQLSAALVLGLCVFNIIERWPSAGAREPGRAATSAPSCHVSN
jgi:sulfite exporter TauE/SafE